MRSSLGKKYMVKLALRSPLHINSGDGSLGYLSVIMADKKPVIPASTIKGKMKDNFIKLIGGYPESHGSCKGPCGCSVCSIFGGAGFQPSRIYISDLHPEEGGHEPHMSVRTGTSVDRYRRVAKDEALYRIQIVEKGTFTGEMEIYFTHHTIQYEKELLLSLRMIEAVGMGKSRGYGFVKVEVENCV